MDKNKSLGVSGIAGSGKDTLAKMLIAELYSRGLTKYTTYAFAGPLKDFAMKVFNFSDYDVYDQEGKEIPFVNTYNKESFKERFEVSMEYLLNELSIGNTGTVANWKEDFGTDKYEVLDTYWRDFLEVLEGQREQVSILQKFVDWWNPSQASITFTSTPRVILQLLGTEFFRDRIANNFWTAIAPKTNVIYTDLRFGNEGTFIKENEGIIIGITGRTQNTTKASGHSSENVDVVIRAADFHVENTGTLEDLRNTATRIIDTYFGEKV